MTDYTTIRVSKAAKASAQEAKRDGETWNDYLQRCTDTPPSVTEFVPIEEVAGREVPAQSVDLSEVNAKLSQNYEAIKEAAGAAQSAEKMLEDMGGQR